MFRSAILLLCLVLPLAAQVPAPPGLVPPKPDEVDPAEPLDAPPVDPGNPAGLRAVPDPNQPTTLNFPNLTGQDVADLYYTYTGQLVIVTSEAAAAEVSIIVPGQMTYGQATRILEQKLNLEGFSLQQGDDDLLILAMAASPTSGVKTGRAPLVDDLDDPTASQDEFITYVMDFEYLKPEEAMRAFQTVVQQFGPAGTIAAVPNASALIISANRPMVKLFIELKSRIDVPSARVGTKFVDVEYADVEELAERLNEIFNNQQAAQQSARVQRTGAPTVASNVPPVPGASALPDGGGGSAGEDTPINILPQTRTNRIFLMGRPVDIVFVEGLIRDFDSPSTKRNFMRKKLRYLPVTEFIPVAADALERTLGTASATGGSTSTRRPTSTTNRGGGLNTQQNRNQAGGGGQAGTGQEARAGLAGQTFETAPESLLIGKTLLVGDNLSNSVVVNGPPHHIEIIEDLILELDQPSEQIAITAVFGRYDLGNNRSFGVDIAQLFDQTGGDFGGAFQNRTGVPSVIDPRTLTNFDNLLGAPGAAAAGLSAYGLVGDDFAVFINALEANENFTALSRPTVFTTNNGEARISSGSRIAVPTSTFQGNTNGFSTNVEFRDIVLELLVRPLVNGDDEVTLEISLVRDDIGGDRVIQGFGNVPDINTDEIATTVMVPNRSTIVLGGLITETDRQAKSGVPILGSIPFLGRLFSTTSTEVDRSELVILIHPTIISNHAQLDSYQRAFDVNATGIAPKARASVEQTMLPERGAYAPAGGAGKAVPVMDDPRRSGGPQYQDNGYQDQGYEPETPSRGAGIATSPMQRALQQKRKR